MRRRSLAVVLLVLGAPAASACASSGHSAEKSTATAQVATPKMYTVGRLNETFVDAKRPTAANGTAAARTSRTLPTVVFYPTDRADAPFPLIVFAHGLGSSGVEYQGLLRRWAAAGFVVAAPRFPLTNSETAGGIDPGDYINQPADVSYVITAVIQASARSTGTLAGLVNPDAIGAAGHSLGGITTFGLAANTCCHDGRVKAAIVMSGDTLVFPGGTFDYSQAPPLLFVHGTSDALVPYESSVDAFNHARGPKGLVTVIGGDHGATVAPTAKAFESVVRTTTDFFDAYVRGDPAAAGRIGADAVSGVTRIVFDAEAGSSVTVPTAPTTPPRVHHATASAVTGLTNGRVVAINWSNFTPGKTVNVVQCSKKNSTDASACDLKDGVLLRPDPTGTGSTTIKIVAGAVGTGICDRAHPDCVIVVNDGGSLEPSASVRIPIAFAAG